MATGGEVPGQSPGKAGSEELDQLKCQPCLEDGHLREAVGMCVQCDEYLCEQCFKIHILPKPMRNHQLLDIEQMRQGQIRASTRDMCTEKCQVHKDEITKYYCIKHHRLGCTACVTLDHKTCEDVHYIPHASEALESNEEYVEAERQLKSALDIFKKVSENVTLNYEELETSCIEAVQRIKEFRRMVDEALSKIEAELIEKIEAIKSEEMNSLAAIKDKYKLEQEELQAAWTKIEALLNSQQNCGAFINMMKTQEKLAALETLTKQATGDASYNKRQIKFLPNRDTLETLKLPDALGTVSVSGRKENLSGSSRQGTVLGSEVNIPTQINPAQAQRVRTASSGGRIERLEHARDLNVKTGTDKSTCYITGLVILPDDKLVITDRRNDNIKAMDVQSGNMLSQLKLLSGPWDVTAISSSKVAVTLPGEKKVAIITVGKSAMSTDRSIDVGGECRGVDHRNGKLAVSFTGPFKVQVLSLQGSVLHTLSNDKLGNPLFNWPYYLTYGQDDSTLYVSNLSGNNVVCVKLDGNVVAKYTDNELQYGPYQPLLDDNRDVLVCAGECSPYAKHHMTGDCNTLGVLIKEADGLGNPNSICFNDKKDMLFVGMCECDNIKVYKVERGSR